MTPHSNKTHAPLTPPSLAHFLAQFFAPYSVDWLADLNYKSPKLSAQIPTRSGITYATTPNRAQRPPRGITYAAKSVFNTPLNTNTYAVADFSNADALPKIAPLPQYQYGALPQNALAHAVAAVFTLTRDGIAALALPRAVLFTPDAPSIEARKWLARGAIDGVYLYDLNTAVLVINRRRAPENCTITFGYAFSPRVHYRSDWHIFQGDPLAALIPEGGWEA